MAARVSQRVGQDEDPHNHLLMHAMGPNVAGVIGTAVAAGVMLALFGESAQMIPGHAAVTIIEQGAEFLNSILTSLSWA
jgi:hypothetical protein